jgi:predicted RecA/RadA family phage recombinase
MAFFQRTDESGVLYLAPGDNIAVATRELAAGSTVDIGGAIIRLGSRVDVGHKFAVLPIAPGDRVIKYGAPIGVATTDIAPGDYVHIHNLRSDYLPSYTLDPVDAQE